MNERDIINMISGMTAGTTDKLIMGIGDDCAVIKKDAENVLLMTMDTLVESVHFDKSWHPPYQLGRKSISVNVSDIAAMGGEPNFVLLSAGLPKQFDQQWFREFSRGVSDACRQYDCMVVGGDTVRCPEGYSFTVAVIGETKASRVVYRHSARLGDDIWVSGNLGNAAAGLALFASGMQTKHHHLFLNAHLDPHARVDFGRMLAKESLVSAMMDLSDGLATDLAHLCRCSGVQGRVDESAVPFSSGLREVEQLVGKSAVELALTGGEDYELLFTAQRKNKSAIFEAAGRCGLEVARIGSIEEGEGVTLVATTPEGRVSERTVSYSGYDHFPETE